jgi:hypothetical protein
MHDQHIQQGGNPLRKFFRQPKIYLTLPSKGKFYSPEGLEMTESGELPVFAMTAKDEIMMKTPDALLNGQSTVDVIESCIPNIKNAWEVSTLDLDAILIALRIATYGESMDIDITTPVTKTETTYAVNMQQMLTDISNHEFVDTLHLDSMTIKIRPLTYKEYTSNSLRSFEEQRVFNVLNDDSMPEDEKLSIFNRAFKSLTEMTINNVEQSIVSITIEGETVNNPEYIKEFIDNSDKSTFKAITDHIEQQRQNFAIKPLVINATPEEIEQGVPETYEVPISFDPSNFFA